MYNQTIIKTNSNPYYRNAHLSVDMHTQLTLNLRFI